MALVDMPPPVSLLRPPPLLLSLNLTHPPPLHASASSSRGTMFMACSSWNSSLHA
jgi:hypothetical protein